MEPAQGGRDDRPWSKASSGAGLALTPVPSISNHANSRALDDLHRDRALELVVEGAEDEAHAAAAELALDLVAPEPPRHGRGLRIHDRRRLGARDGHVG